MKSYEEINNSTMNSLAANQTGNSVMMYSGNDTVNLKKLAADMERIEQETMDRLFPETKKKHLISRQVDSVVRDTDGEIVAKLYKDGSFMWNNQSVGVVGMGGGRSNEDKIRQIEKLPNMIVTHYENLTDFDLLPEEIASAKKQLLLPERYSGYKQIIQQNIAFSEYLLTL